MVVISVAAMAVLGAISYLSSRSPAPEPIAILPSIQAPLENSSAAPLPEQEPAHSGFNFDSVDVVIRRNDTLDRIFRQLQLNITDLATIRGLPGVRQALDILRPGDALTLMHREGELQGLLRQINDVQTLKVTRAPSGFLAEIM